MATQKYLKGELNEVLAREEIMLQQKSRVQWLKEGDSNANFFMGKQQVEKGRIVLMDEASNTHGDMERKDSLILFNISIYFLKPQHVRIGDGRQF